MLLEIYNRFPKTFVKGDKNTLYDKEEKSYLDFASGIGVNSIGYNHPLWVKNVTEQAVKLAHTSNLYHTEPAAKLAEKLVEISGLSGVFFANSGAESNEGLIKMARKYAKDKYGNGRHTIVTLENSFHGRTITTLSATGQDKFHQHFHPFTEGFIHVPANDIDAIHGLGEGICAVLLESVQGEGGVCPLEKDYVKQVAKICAEKDWLLLFDEVQTGIGRTGCWFGYQHFGVLPDGISFAKGIGGGLPLGGFILGEKCKHVFSFGDHGTTFGGNPIACAGGLAVLEVVGDILADVEEKSQFVINKLSGIKGLKDVRGRGLMIGAVVDEKLGTVGDVVTEILDFGVVTLSAGSDVLRLLPPLTVTMEELEVGLGVIEEVCARRLG